MSSDAAEIMKIVNDWCVESNDTGGLDASDLYWRLTEAGFAFPEDDTEELT